MSFILRTVMPQLVAPADFFEKKLIFGLFLLGGITICFHWVRVNKVVSDSFDLSIC